ncbi:MAG TPA: lipoprotein insertase outer membrane protein LolB [Rhodanobacteraceae bacterium]|nr:lipoprotein insertase outer membrane protein LolB [Rhodanobacteraceae bacterium]
MTRLLAPATIATCAGLLLAACAPVPVRKPGTPEQLAAQSARERTLGVQRNWSLEGRFAASDGHHGGSGGLTWQQTGRQFRFTLRAPITGKTVQLSGGPDGAVLTGAGKQPLAGRSAGEVLDAEFGWNVPVSDLAWWVRGLRAPGSPAILTFGANGLPATLDQDGWHIDYRDWYAERTPPLPRKVYASRDPYTVRVMIQNWVLDSAP